MVRGRNPPVSYNRKGGSTAPEGLRVCLCGQGCRGKLSCTLNRKGYDTKSLHSSYNRRNTNTKTVDL